MPTPIEKNNTIGEITNFINTLARNIERDVAREIWVEAVRIVPVDTGRLKASIQIEEGPGDTRVVARAPYAADVEFGIGQREQPYLRNFFYNNFDVIVENSVKNSLSSVSIPLPSFI